MLGFDLCASPKTSLASNFVQTNKSPSEETINGGPPCACACKKLKYADPVVHVRLRIEWIRETPQQPTMH